MNESSYVGLDVHKDFIQVAIIEPDTVTTADWGKVSNTEPQVEKLIRRLKKTANSVRVCYEAGPTGFGLARRLGDEPGFECTVVAPSLIPKKPGSRVKTDRRDAKMLAEFLRAGLLTPVQPPSEEDEARRELCRARDAAKTDEKTAKHRLSKFLLRQGRVFREGKVLWTDKHMLWLERQRFDILYMQTTFDAFLRALEQARARVRELDEAIARAAQDEAVKEPVALLRCLKGVELTTAMGIATELYAVERFESPRGLASFVGLTPSEHSTGGKPNRGGITKAGNGRLRRLFVEAAWNYTRGNKTGRVLRKRREGQPAWAIDIAENAQHRLHRRYWRLVAQGKAPNKALIAVARELTGFVWAILVGHNLKLGEQSEEMTA